MNASVVKATRAAVAAGLPRRGCAVLAVSGGIDSMVLLDAAAATVPADRLIVATFDHQSGRHAARAVGLVVRVALMRGLTVVVGRDDHPAEHREAAWRDARWRFLREVADSTDGIVSTAHTRNDQVETVLFRAFRGAGTRGLAGLFAESAVRHPLIGVDRDAIERYAEHRGLAWSDDPSNRSRRFARNRIRLDILPAIRNVRPTIDDELVVLSRAAARWRRQVDVWIETCVSYRVDGDGLELRVAVDSLGRLAPESLAIVWPALAGRVGVVLDWRGIQRIVDFTIGGRAGRHIPLSGGWRVYRSRDALEVRRAQHAGVGARTRRMDRV
jgi:tRNA(Ile)-lysidine synthase